MQAKSREISSRKSDHIRISLKNDVRGGQSALFEDVVLLHNAVPGMDHGEISLKTRLFGKNLSAPLLVSGMVGGTPEAGRMNRAIAEAVEALGLAMGVGSQRIMLEKPGTADTFRVRKYAKRSPVFGNLGLAQFTQGNLKPKDARRAMEAIEADGMFIHLNPAQELVQPEGDRNFSRGIERLAEICDELDGVPVIAKETGCGVSGTVARRLIDAGISGIDVSGAGGTSWIAVERIRSGDPVPGDALLSAGWGIPTAASVMMCSGLGVPVIASGGMGSGVDCAKAIALGAAACSIAQPVLAAYSRAGRKGVEARLLRAEDELRAAMFLTGSRDPRALAKAERRIFGRLGEWARAKKA